MYARNLRTHRKRQSKNGSERRTKNNDGNQGQTGGHGGVVEEEVGGEDGVASDRWLRLDFFLFLPSVMQLLIGCSTAVV